MTTSPTGFLLIDKEGAWTSHDVVAKVRRHVGGKVGHAGTLDPMATGLLVVGLGRATRLLRFVQDAPKEYLAVAQFGVATDSLDADGAVMSREPLPVEREAVEGALERFRGDILQVPPMVSARRVEGKRLYELAREGKVVERDARSVTIHELELTDFAPSDYPSVSLRVVCSTGTYIRTLADDIARAMGGRAHLTELRRTRNGLLSVAEASSVSEVVEAADGGRIHEVVVSPSDALSWLPQLSIDEPTEFRVRNGRPLDGEMVDTEVDARLRVCSSDGTLLAVYRRDPDALRPEVVIA
ncbi:MAG: tRNA pseudouridine(55) synthase TruB [Acidimicrobiia bacterium]|nr:tRNA pseudouridine(55) synthase TruB [Acidimicrobiia bacterium]